MDARLPKTHVLPKNGILELATWEQMIRQLEDSEEKIFSMPQNPGARAAAGRLIGVGCGNSFRSPSGATCNDSTARKPRWRKMGQARRSRPVFCCNTYLCRTRWGSARPLSDSKESRQDNAFTRLRICHTRLGLGSIGSTYNEAVESIQPNISTVACLKPRGDSHRKCRWHLAIQECGFVPRPSFGKVVRSSLQTDIRAGHPGRRARVSHPFRL